MQTCHLKSYAKINLFLEILDKRADGYHEVAMVLQSVGLFDQIRLKLIEEGIYLTCNHPQVPLDNSNLAIRAAQLVQKTFDCPDGVSIYLDKQIPIAAGLAGGSSNAAAVLVGLNQLWGLGLTIADLQDLAAQLGSDIPFCIRGGTQLAAGRGEVLEPLVDLHDIPLLLAKPQDLAVSTAWAYQNYQGVPRPQATPTLKEMLTAINHQDATQMGRCLYNALEVPVLAHYPQVADLKLTMMSESLGTMMSGSGPTVFALMPSIEMAIAHQARLAKLYPQIDFWATSTVPTGIVLELD